MKTELEKDADALVNAVTLDFPRAMCALARATWAKVNADYLLLKQTIKMNELTRLIVNEDCPEYWIAHNQARLKK